MTSLTLEQLLEIHTIVVQETGGAVGLRDLGRVEAALATQTQRVFGEELYTTLFEKSAALIRGIVADHPFVDGNKRTALLVGLTFLSLNNVQLVAKPGEIEDFAVRVATDHLDVPIIATCLKDHSNES